MIESLFSMQDKICVVTGGSRGLGKEMVRDLNDMLAQRMRGEEPDFDSFMEKYG